MSSRTEWEKEKKKLDSVGLNTKKLFDQKLGDALDASDTADDKYFKVPSNAKDETIKAAKKARKETAAKAEKICRSYAASLKMLNVTTAAQKGAIDNAQNWLLKLLAPLINRQNFK